jgi:hypothetical protein
LHKDLITNPIQKRGKKWEVFETTFPFVASILPYLLHHLYVKISTCEKFEFDLYKNKVIKIHIQYMCILHWTKNWLGVLLIGYYNCSRDVCGSSIKA